MSTAGGVVASAHAPTPMRIESGYRRMWRIAWPVSVSTSTLSVFMVFNLFWVGHLGTDAVAAVSVCGHFLFVVFGLTQVVVGGSVAIVSRRVGEGRIEDAYRAGAHGALLAGVLGTALAVAGWMATPAIVGFFGASDAVDALAVPYLRITLVAEPFLFVSMAIAASFSAAGDTRMPMLVTGLTSGLNAVLDPLLIFAPGERSIAGLDVGWLGLGVDGAAIADVIAGLVGVCAFVLVSVGLDRPFPRPRDGLRLRPEIFWQIVRIGTPASASLMARPLSTFFLLRVIASFGTTALAAFGIALRAMSINWIPFSGLQVAVAALVGQNLGARDVPEAERVVARGVRVAVLLAAGFCVLYGWYAEDFIVLFDRDPAVVTAGVLCLQLLALGLFASGPTVPLVAAMNGAGDTRPPMVITVLANWPLKLPLCWALAVPGGFGTTGVWIGLLVSLLAEGAMTAWWFRRSAWRTRRV